MISRRLAGLSTCIVLTVVAAACADDVDQEAVEAVGPVGAPKAVTIAITDDGCSPSAIDASAGEVTFAVTNETRDQAEFEILTAAPAILVEKILGAGSSGSYTVALTAGQHSVICGAPSHTRATLSITGEGGHATPTSGVVDQAGLDALVSGYATYVGEQLTLLQTGVRRFTDAVRSGDVEQAKALYPEVREPWERIEPVAELFPDSDGVIDSRSDDFELREADPGFTGFHALEYGLWANGTIDGATVDPRALADRLDADIGELVTAARRVEYQPAVITNGAAALIEEAAQTKITGEEDRYSMTDLFTFAANVDGSKEIFELVHDLLQRVDPALATDLQASFADVDSLLATYIDGEGIDVDGKGYQTYDRVSTADRARFKTAMAQLSEELARVSGSLGLVVAS